MVYFFPLQILSLSLSFLSVALFLLSLHQRLWLSMFFSLSPSLCISLFLFLGLVFSLCVYLFLSVCFSLCIFLSLSLSVQNPWRGRETGCLQLEATGKAFRAGLSEGEGWGFLPGENPRHTRYPAPYVSPTPCSPLGNSDPNCPPLTPQVPITRQLLGCAKQLYS